MIGDNLVDAFAGVEYTPGARAQMRDGARLVADIYRPRAEGDYPVLLMRTAYGRDVASSIVYAHPAWFARRGFIVVIQDVRGRGDSDGSYYPFMHEREDGFDSVQWAGSLPGSNGCVGLYGFSYQGVVQLFAALDRPPALRAIAPHMTAFDLYSGWFYRNGLLELSTMFAWANQMLREDARRVNAPSARSLDESWSDLGGLLGQLPIRRARPLTNSDLPRYAADWFEHSEPDDYWRPWNLLQRAKDLGYPMFHLSGWYDIFLRGSIEGFVEVARQRDDQFLLATPWAHAPWGRRVLGVDFGPAAVPGVDQLLVEWFRHWLRPDAGAKSCPLRGCRYFSMGDNAWHESERWPPPGSSPRPFHLQSGGRANSLSGDGRLSGEGSSGSEDVLSYEPEVPVAAPGGGFGPAPFGPHDLAAQQQSNAMLVYTSERLDAPLHVAGRPYFVAYIQATSPTVDVIVRLSRVTADGRATLLSLGAARARAGAPVSVRIELDPVAASWAPGDCVRLDIANSAFPLFPRNSGTEKDALDVAGPEEFRRALFVIFHDERRPAALYLPEVCPR